MQEELCITYNLKDGHFPDGEKKMKVAQIPGQIKHWEIGYHRNRSGKEIFGVRVIYIQYRKGYRREGFSVRAKGREYKVQSVDVSPTEAELKKIIPLPKTSVNINCHKKPHPKECLQ